MESTSGSSNSSNRDDGDGNMPNSFSLNVFSPAAACGAKTVLQRISHLAVLLHFWITSFSVHVTGLMFGGTFLFIT